MRNLIQLYLSKSGNKGNTGRQNDFKTECSSMPWAC